MGIRAPLSYRPRLTVSAWTYFVDNEGGGRMLTVQVVNPGQAPVRVTSVSCSLFFADLPLGNRNVDVPLTELEGEPKPPCALGVGESVRWSTSWPRLKEKFSRELERSEPSHSNVAGWVNPERLPVIARIAIRRLLSRGRSFVAVRDDRGRRHEATITWEPPTLYPPYP
jgi:hypothetical protein